MSAPARIEAAIGAALALADGAGRPPRLLAAMQHAVFPGGARVRPRLTLAVARACAEDEPVLSDAAAAAVELLHCASLVHDDLPCFDDAALRRGRPSVHCAYGERLAVLAGDALIVLAFQALGAAAAARAPQRLPALLALLAGGVGMPLGIAAGQAWECEPQVRLRDYQRAKTGALFAAATGAGALAAGSDATPWLALGEALGEAYQVADDIRDVAASVALLGKPVGQDIALDRPSTARELGLEGAVQQFRQLMAAASAAVPACPGAAELRQLVRREAERLLPPQAVAGAPAAVPAA